MRSSWDRANKGPVSTWASPRPPAAAKLPTIPQTNLQTVRGVPAYGARAGP